MREVLAEIDADERARAARVQQGRPRRRRGQAARRRPPRLGRRQRRDGRGHRRCSCARSPTACARSRRVVELAVPYDRGDVLAAIHREGEVVSTTDEPDAPARPGPAVGRLGRPPRRVRRAPRRRPRDRRAGHGRGFVPPPYPYDRLDRLAPLAAALAGGAVDLSIGTPIDPPPPAVVAALSTSGPERGYPPSIGTAALREAAARWIDAPLRRRRADRRRSAPCIGTKEFVGTLPQWLRLRTPDRDTVLYPAASYPTYEMGAILAGCRPVAVPLTPAGGLDLAAIDPADAGRALRAVGQQPDQPDRRARRPRRRRRVGPARTACRCSPTSATSSSRGTGPGAPSSSTASTASSPCTRCRSARTWPAAGSASTPATPSSCTTCRRCASTSG